MANKASSATVQADMQPPNYRAAVQRIRSIKQKRDRISGINGEISDIYAKVEGHKVNRKAGKIFAALDNMEADERNDVMRSLNGLCDASGWDQEAADLVDGMEGTVVSLRVGGAAVGTDELDEALDEDDSGDEVDEALAPDTFTESSEEELAAQAGRADTAAKSRARKQLDKANNPTSGTGAAAIAAMKLAAVPFTGDNSDLAGDDFEPQGAA